METILAKIVEAKRNWLFAKKRLFPLDVFKKEIIKTDRDFYQALESDKAVFVLECKKGSPSKGVIRKKFDLNEIAAVYKNYANVISVLTDEEFFMGSFANLEIVRKQVTQPILCKDFIIDEYQIYLARHYQADAVLLMLSVLNDNEYKKLAKVANRLGMGILTEVSNEEELERAIKLKAKVIGINNRNLRDLSIDLNTTRLLAPKIPKGTIIISESGIYKNQEIRDLRNYVNGFLIGSSIMSERNLELAVRKLVYGFNKVCGLTSVENAQKAYNAGAVYGGFIFVEKSPRCVDFAMAKQITKKVRLNYVGVFANASIEDVVNSAYGLKLSAVQLHGDENQEYIDALKSKLHRNCQIWKAYGIDKTVPEFFANVDYHLLDAQVDGKSGGTGKAFDWSLIKDRKNIILAGGLNPKNIAKAIELRCSAYDINSGAESEPGQKDQQKLKEVFEVIRDY
ncbi:bifunctional indole-3-glycerol-phosphate synthase TrpC/phosphoribosylanthranilate isomerase TrpF [Francisella philomiragia]|uniref:bifunctional indole-3-glycerol-phosphate synthase TrpC/phosphoribosylanthranilate isomerase TrpF n=1 Tax=Francisella philomiragia TaxID=28110 RepID=UPI001904A3A5|nr:bifunctional indole-3-glycerol-phosphate synthase TrpC/phosphoribosylanthranilate isomerase TrpF [Francisella philomiragia]MBK2092706.1 bifunctional indole-3-glycerol-phosphate synthase TrpC/phosphoribosylanthranilate isomerase TrpF [Francisella philomiragia]MBK2256940.1 bifunctional indole-3-glycerol-phosphate synthase TrpC/phosphoribosylanthranilate isomerase TrpF [Francisella philomiragia]MBK2269598.1 bifunctional indole-3-glycerol-phosphate synthase TrpC/phosphoribosylanthranilate isomera